ncbi:MAG TPA: tetratricopeptide repeat protein [Telmatospirillum sp.]|nr:tetratricopeptide repeat protein [Telmatospirillum sp.]
MNATQPPSPDQDPSTFLDRVATSVPLFGVALDAHRQGQMAKARSIYLDLIDQPGMAAVCLHQLGVVAGHQGDHGRAAELISRAISLDGSQPMFFQNLAVSLERQGNVTAALDALIDFGCALQKGELHSQAIPIYRRVLAADPRRYAAYVNMGTGLAWMGETSAAVPALLTGVALYAHLLPELKDFLDQLLPPLRTGGVLDEGFSLPLAPPSGVVNMIEHALATLGKALTELGYPAEALLSYRTSLAIEPGFALAHWNLALALLTDGDFVNGWREYEWRWHWDKFPEVKRRLPAPEWRGQPLAGKRIVVYAEQGYGDATQFSPLVRRLAAEAGSLLFEVTSPQVRLFRESFDGGNIMVIERSANPHLVRTHLDFDYVVSLMSLPERMGLSLDDLPLAIDYLKPMAGDKARWSERLAPARGLKVGLVWAGRPTHSDDRKRSLPLATLARLFDVEGAAWLSLQVGPATAQLSAIETPIRDLSADLHDFADTAAAIANLDLIITVDTAVAHLAGGLGKPTWVLLPRITDWRWGGESADTPWYPTMRLFRQAAIGDWDPVIERVRHALVDHLAAPDA